MQLNWITASHVHAGRLELLDIKCFDTCWDKQVWQEGASNFQVRLATAPNGKDIGFWCGSLSVPDTPDQYPRITVYKIGVSPYFRRLGVSRAIVRDIRCFARNVGTDTQVSTSICEPLLYPKWEDCYIKDWLRKVGFRSATPAMVDVPHSLYGVNFHHGFNFELSTATHPGVDY